MRYLPAVLLSTVAIASGVTFTIPVQAQSLPAWTYTLDSPNDSLGVDANGNIQPGGSIYEIFGMAVKDDIATDSIWFAFSANLPLYGENLPNPYLDSEFGRFAVPDSNIGWGDLFLDFSGSGNLRAASDANQLFGIKFSMNNDSGVPTLGVYSGASIASVTTSNAGYSNLANNNNLLSARSGRTASMGDLAWNDPYFAPYTTPGAYSRPESLMPNVLASGSKIGEVTLLNQVDLEKAGLDSSVFNAATGEIFGFRIPKALLPAGEFIATLLTECINDGIAMVSRLAPPLPPLPPQPYICPVTDGQRNALMPDRMINGVKIFENAPSGAWFDPPATMGIQLITDGDTLFTAINGFPCAVLPPDSPAETKPAPFNVLVKNEQGLYELVGQYFPGQSGVNFVELFGKGISEFIITGIDPDAWIAWLPENPSPLAFPLEFNQPGTFALRLIPDVTQIPMVTLPPGERIPEMPGISDLPTPVGPELLPPCFDGGQCGSAAVPEPSTIAGLAFAVAGALKLRHDRRSK